MSASQLEVRQEVWASLSRLNERYEAARAAADLVIDHGARAAFDWSTGGLDQD